ncbi:MAG: hypothetical protein ACM3TT_10085 [Syntrophothermus sp.]
MAVAAAAMTIVDTVAAMVITGHRAMPGPVNRDTTTQCTAKTKKICSGIPYVVCM